MIFLLIGRSGCGKDALGNVLIQKGLKTIKTYTTRPQRSENDQQHIYITEQEADNIPDHLAEVTFNNYRYFMTKEQILNDQPDFIIIEPTGAKILTETFPDICFDTIYITTTDQKKRKEKAIERDHNENAEENFNKRCEEENPVFTQFEKIIDEKKYEALEPNNQIIHYIINDYQHINMNANANNIINYWNARKNLKKISEQCIEYNLIKKTVNNKLEIALQNPLDINNPIVQEISLDNFISILFRNPDNRHAIIDMWMPQAKI